MDCILMQCFVCYEMCTNNYFAINHYQSVGLLIISDQTSQLSG